MQAKDVQLISLQAATGYDGNLKKNSIFLWDRNIAGKLSLSSWHHHQNVSIGVKVQIDNLQNARGATAKHAQKAATR